MENIKPILESAGALYGFNQTQLKPLPGGHISHVYGFDQDSRSYVLDREIYARAKEAHRK